MGPGMSGVKAKKTREVAAVEGANGTLRREPRRGAIEVARALGLDVATLKEMYRVMLLARMVDERCWLLNRGGKAPFVISCQGHEAAQVGSVYALDRDKD